MAGSARRSSSIPSSGKAHYIGDDRSWSHPIQCGKSRKGKFQIRRKTRRDPTKAKLRTIKEALWRRMHHLIPEQGKWLGSVVRSYFNYHAVPTNSRAMWVFWFEVVKRWQRILNRRSQQADSLGPE
jgi:hypothetical protein